MATYGYLANSRQIEHITFHNGTADVMRTSKHWDSLDRLTLIEHERLINITAENPATISSYGCRYNLANQRYRVDEVDGSYWVYAYDDLGQLTSGKKHFADDTLVPGWQFEYGYDDIGNRESAKEGGDSAGASLRESVYQANELNQYDSRTVPGAVDVTGTAAADADVYVNRQPAWRKDAFYQGLVEAQNSAAPAYPEIRVDAIKPGAGPLGEDVATTQTGHAYLAETPETFGYDDDGQPSEARQQASPTLSEARPNVQLPMTGDGRWVYTWNGENRLVAMETAAVAVAAGAPKQKLAFAYDHIGRRTTKKVYAWDGQAEEWALTSSLRFLYDGWNLQAELEPEGYEVGEGSFVHAVARSYVWGLDLSGSLQDAGGIGGLLFATSGTTTTMPGCDGNGNVVQYVGLDARVPFSCSYSPFGQTIGVEGDVDAPYRFSSKYADESGLVYYGYRYYDTECGRWLNRDPINERGGVNLYQFSGNTPPNAIDAFGDISSKDIWNLVSNYVGSSMDLLWGFSDYMAKQQDAIGYDLGASFVTTTGFKIGANVMFFPESCELASYWYATGNLRADKLQEDKNALILLLHAMPVGLSVGASFEKVNAVPIGTGDHDAESWLEWFYQASGQIGVGLPVGIAASAFASSKWAGVSVGPGIGPGVPVGAIGPVPITASGDLAALYFDKPPLYGWTHGRTYLNVHSDRCVCAALRMLSLEPNEMFMTIMKTLLE